ncbi:MAG: ScyD/ScyE family protein [Rubrivivax sp.]
MGSAPGPAALAGAPPPRLKALAANRSIDGARRRNYCGQATFCCKQPEERQVNPLTKMNMRAALRCAAVAATCTWALSAPAQAAVCTEVATGLLRPIGTVLTPQGRLLVSETGTLAPHSGRISLIEANGTRRTLIDGLPSGVSDIGDPSGPSGILLRGRTLLVAIGVGDVGVLGRNAQGQPVLGSAVENPNGPSSPLFSSVLAIHFSAEVERTSKGFMMTYADQQMLADGQKITMSNGGHDQITVQRLADLPNFVPRLHPAVANNIQMSNPYQMVALGDQLFVSDGGRNLVWRIDMPSAAADTLAAFAPVPNPLFGIFPVGGPFLDAVPTGLAVYGDQLLVTLFRGVPFPPGTSTVQKVDPVSGTQAPLIAGLKTAIDVLPVASKGSTEFLVLQHASVGVFFGGPGQVLRFEEPGGPPSLVADCLTRPKSMVRDPRSGRLLVSEVGGRLVSIAP